MDPPVDLPMDAHIDVPVDAPVDAPIEPPVDAPVDLPVDAPMDVSDAAEAPSVLQGSDETVPPCESEPQYVRVSAFPRVHLIQLIQFVVRSGPSRISWHHQRCLRQRCNVSRRYKYKE